MPHNLAHSLFAGADVSTKSDPHSAFWACAPSIVFSQDTYGQPCPTLRTEVRSRWTRTHLYVLFLCAYESLHLNSSPDASKETFGLWHWDVAEVFLGSDPGNIHRYKEFEVSPQGEWVDLDVDLSQPNHERGWTWSSGFEASARIDRQQSVWNACMRIPFGSIDHRSPQPGVTLRANFCRTHGANQQLLCWQATQAPTFHVPANFGILSLESE